MVRWLTQELAVPRLIVIGTMILSMWTSVALLATVHDLNRQNAWLEHEVAELSCNRADAVRLCSINQLMPSPVATLLTFPEAKLGAALIIFVTVGGVWVLARAPARAKPDDRDRG